MLPGVGRRQRGRLRSPTRSSPTDQPPWVTSAVRSGPEGFQPPAAKGFESWACPHRLQMFIEPIDGQLLSLLSFLAINAVMLDPLDSNQFLDTSGTLVSKNSVVLVVEQFLLLGDDEQLRAVLAPT